jgi:hypothetical protein
MNKSQGTKLEWTAPKLQRLSAKGAQSTFSNPGDGAGGQKS